MIDPALVEYVENAFESGYTHAEMMSGVARYFPGKVNTACLYWSRLQRNYQRWLANQ